MSRRKSASFEASVANYGTCPDCGKQRWVSRKAARLVIRQTHRREGKPHAYQCGDFWHVGHPPQLLRQGVIAREDVRMTPR